MRRGVGEVHNSLSGTLPPTRGRTVEDWRVQFVPVKPRGFDPVFISRLGLRKAPRGTAASNQMPPSLPRRSFTLRLETRPPTSHPFPAAAAGGGGGGERVFCVGFSGRRVKLPWGKPRGLKANQNGTASGTWETYRSFLIVALSAVAFRRTLAVKSGRNPIRYAPT